MTRRKVKVRDIIKVKIGNDYSRTDLSNNSIGIVLVVGKENFKVKFKNEKEWWVDYDEEYTIIGRDVIPETVIFT